MELDFSWVSTAIIVGLVLFISTTIWSSLGMLVGNAITIYGAAVIVCGAIVAVSVLKPFFFSSQSRTK